MSTWATIIVTKANQAAAQELTSSDMFTNEVKKTLSRYFISSGSFSDDYYAALVDSGLIYHIETDDTVRPTQTLSDLGMSWVVTD